MATNNPWRTIVVIAVVSLMTGLLPGCSGDDDGGVLTVPCVALQGSTAPAPDTVVAEDGGSDCSVLRVNLIVTDVDNLFGANLVVTYPSNLVSFAGASEAGSILTSGSAVNVTAGVSNPGELTVGITRLGNTTTGINVVGGQILLRLSFVRIATQGSGAFGIRPMPDSELFEPNSPPPPPVTAIPGIDFFGATVVVFQL
jgi:hypothetical protein